MKKLNLAQTIESINKDYGTGTIMSMGTNDTKNVKALSTGSILIDDILGIGGVPKGRIIEIYGPESSGKTTLALQIIASAHKSGGTAAFIDAEHALDPSYATRLGVNMKKLYLSQPGCGEEALEIAEKLIFTSSIDVIVIDSVAALVPRVELEGSMGDSQMGLQARLMSKAMRKITGALAKTDCVVIFINQIREKIGVMFGPNTTTSGGRALKFFSSVRIEVKRKETIKDKNIPIGSRTRIKIVKNKVSPPFRETDVEIYFGEGICSFTELINIAVEENIIEKNGSWYSYKKTKLGQGKEGTKQFLKMNPEIFKKIENEIFRKRETPERKTA